MITFKSLLNAIFSLYKPFYISFSDFTNPFSSFPGVEQVAGLFDTPDQPAAPDYTGAAEATAAGNLENARYATMANRPNQYTPWGSVTWSQDPNNPDLWTQNVNLSPEQQRLLDLNTQTNQQMAQIGLAGLGAVSPMFEQGFDIGMTPMQDYQTQFQGIYDNMLQRVNSDIARDRDAMVSQLVASGIPRGSEAWNAEMQRIDRQLTDARQQAELAATQQVQQRQAGDIENRRQQIAELLTQRNQPLNELNAFRTGNQVSMPSFPGFSQQQAVPGADYMGATTAQGNWDLAGWNADVSRQNAILGGLFNLGAGYLGGM